MKITFLGYDYTLDIVQRLIADGHDVMQIFTFPCDGLFAFNNQINDFSQHFGIPISDNKIDQQNINSLIGQGCEIFVCAGYPYKIPPIEGNNIYGINLHPAYLPRGRGVMPLPYIIMNDKKAAGFSVHKLIDDFDAGDILYQKAIELDEQTDVEILAAKIAIHAPEAISKIVGNIEHYWSNATQQNNANASSYLAPSEAMRSLNWEEGATEINLKGRAFGRFGMVATIKNDMGDSQQLAVFNFKAWEESHDHEAGTLLRSSPREIIIVIKDGYICLKEFQVIE